MGYRILCFVKNQSHKPCFSQVCSTWNSFHPPISHPWWIIFIRYCYAPEYFQWLQLHSHSPCRNHGTCGHYLQSLSSKYDLPCRLIVPVGNLFTSAVIAWWRCCVSSPCSAIVLVYIILSVRIKRSRLGPAQNITIINTNINMIHSYER